MRKDNDYDNGRGDGSFNVSAVHSVYDKDLDALASIVDPKNKQVILDLCSGYGDVSKHLLQHMKVKGIKDTRLVLIDNSERQIRRAGKNLEGMEGAQILHADALKIPFEDNHFDTIVLKMGLHDVNDQDQNIMLKEAHRVLKPDGKIVIWDLKLGSHTKTPFSDIIRTKNRLSEFWGLVKNRTFLTVKEIFDKLKNSGFKGFEVKHTIHPDLSMDARREELVSVHRTSITDAKGGVNEAEELILKEEGDKKLEALKAAVKKRLSPKERKELGYYEKDGDVRLRPRKAIFVAYADKSGASPTR